MSTNLTLWMKVAVITALIAIVLGASRVPVWADDDDDRDEDEHEYVSEHERRSSDHERDDEMEHDDDDEQSRYRGVPTSQLDAEGQLAFDAWKAECGSCHMAYPPQLLPAESWRKLVDGLTDHFGTDASLDQVTVDQITPLLERFAGASSSHSRSQPPLRITETRWFRHEHDEISRRVWKRPEVLSPSNCVACHTGAEQGNFNEDAVRIPR